MAKKRSKRYRQAAELFEEDKEYPLAEAIDILKKFPPAKYDETVSTTEASTKLSQKQCPLA